MVPDRASPNLPSRDFAVSEDFYARLGFVTLHRDDFWMIVCRGPLQLEFFHHPDLDPATSAFQCTVRVADLDEVIGAMTAAQIPVREVGWPRLHEPRLQPWGLRAGFLIDPDGTQLTLIEQPS